MPSKDWNGEVEFSYNVTDGKGEESNKINDKVFVRGNSLYKALSTTSETESKKEARAIGGTLASINSSDENQFITEAFKDDYWALYMGRYRDGSGERKWDDGSLMSYENFQPTSHNWGPHIKMILKDSFAPWEINWKQGGWHPIDTADIASPDNKKLSLIHI